MTLLTRADNGDELSRAQVDENWRTLSHGGDSVTRYGADPTGTTDSLAAFNLAYAALNDGETFVIPDGIFALSDTFTFSKLRSTFDCRGRVIPFGGFSDFLLEFKLTTPGGDPTQVNMGQRVDIRRLYIDGLYQSRGVRFEDVYCTSMRNITVTKAYGKALEIGSDCYENNWHGVNINLCKNRQAFSTPSDWSGATSYIVGDRVRFAHAAYNGGTTYGAADLVESSGVSYMSIRGGNVGNTPASSPTYWVRIDDSFFECMIANTNQSPFSASVLTTNNGTAGNRYWKHVLQYEPVLNIEHVDSSGVTDHQYFYGIDIRDCDAKYLVHIDNNGNDRPVYAIEFHGGIIHTMTPGVPAATDDVLADPDKARHILLGRTIDCKFFGINSRVGDYDDAIGVCYGLTPPGKTSYAMTWTGRIDGEGDRNIGILMGKGQSTLTTQAHHISHLFPVLTGANVATYIDPFNKLGYDVAVPIRGLNVGRRNTRMRLSGDESIANNTDTQLTWGTEDHNPNAAWVVGSPKRLTPPEDWAAWKLSASIEWAANSAGVRIMNFLRNGAAAFSGNNGSNVAASGATYGNKQRIETDVIHRTAVGEYFEVNVLQNSGGALNAVAGGYTWFAIERVI